MSVEPYQSDSSPLSPPLPLELPLEIQFLILDEMKSYNNSELQRLAFVCLAWANHIQSLLFQQVDLVDASNVCTSRFSPSCAQTAVSGNIRHTLRSFRKAYSTPRTFNPSFRTFTPSPPAGRPSAPSMNRRTRGPRLGNSASNFTDRPPWWIYGGSSLAFPHWSASAYWVCSHRFPAHPLRRSMSMHQLCISSTLRSRRMAGSPPNPRSCGFVCAI